MNALLLQPVTDAIKCRAFPQTLTGMAQHWYCRLPPNSISSFKDLSKAFVGQFIGSKMHAKSSASLMNIVQGRNESLRDYMNRFTKEALKVPDMDSRVAMIALQRGTTNDDFRKSLAKKAPESMNALQERAGKYIKVEESMKRAYHPQAQNNNNNNSSSGSGNRKRPGTTEYNVESKQPRVEPDSEQAPKKKGPRFTDYARLNTSRSEILMEIERDGAVRWPKPLRSDPEKRNRNLFCRFHRDTGHSTDDCKQLKDEI